MTKRQRQNKERKKRKRKKATTKDKPNLRQNRYCDSGVISHEIFNHKIL